MNNLNKISGVLYGIGTLTLIGSLIRVILIFKEPFVSGFEELDLFLSLVYIVAGVISGILFFALAEIIRLLDEKKRLQKEANATLLDIKATLKKEEKITTSPTEIDRDDTNRNVRKKRTFSEFVENTINNSKH